MNDEAFDPKLDLVLERVVDVAPELVWKAWTEPERLKRWFTPHPWKTVECEIDLRPGGQFRTVFQSPEGKTFPNVGCYLEVVLNTRLVWTDALLPGFRPAAKPGFPTGPQFKFTAVITIKPEGKGTRYRAVAMHSDEAGRNQHEKMGFADGWGKALDQLVEMCKQRRA